MAFIEPCFGIGHNLSLICQMTSEDTKHQLIIQFLERVMLIKCVSFCGVAVVLYFISFIVDVGADGASMCGSTKIFYVLLLSFFFFF